MCCLQGINSFICFAKVSKLVTKLSSSLTLIDFDFSSKSFKLVDIFGTYLLFDRKKLNVECLLTCFLQKRD